MKRKLFEAVWSDCESDAERVNFILAGRAYETGIMSKALQHDVALAFHFRDQINTDTTGSQRIEPDYPPVHVPDTTALKDRIGKIVIAFCTCDERYEDNVVGQAVFNADINKAIDDWAGGKCPHGYESPKECYVCNEHS